MDGYEMTHIDSKSMEEVPYRYPSNFKVILANFKITQAKQGHSTGCSYQIPQIWPCLIITETLFMCYTSR